LRRWLRESMRTKTGRSALRHAGNAHSGLYGDLLDAIRDGRDPRADGLSGRDALELVLAIYRSARARLPVALPLSEGSTKEMTGYFDA